MLYITHSDEETKKLGTDIAANLKGGDIVLLYGDLGAGKTTFAKGLAVGLGIMDEVTSPTFALMNVYNDIKDIKALVHIDTYRLKNEQELLDIGVEDYLGDPNTVCLIEWPDKISSLLQNKKKIAINIEHTSNNERKILLNF